MCTLLYYIPTHRDIHAYVCMSYCNLRSETAAVDILYIRPFFYTSHRQIRNINARHSRLFPAMFLYKKYHGLILIHALIV